MKTLTLNPTKMNAHRLLVVVLNWIGGSFCLWVAGVFTPRFLGVFTTFMQYAIPIAGLVLSIVSVIAGITTIMKNWKEGKLVDSVPKFISKRFYNKPKSKPKNDGTTITDTGS